VGLSDNIGKCNSLEMLLMNVGFWTSDLWATVSLGANILRIDIQFGNDLT